MGRRSGAGARRPRSRGRSPYKSAAGEESFRPERMVYSFGCKEKEGKDTAQSSSLYTARRPSTSFHTVNRGWYTNKLRSQAVIICGHSARGSHAAAPNRHTTLGTYSTLHTYLSSISHLAEVGARAGLRPRDGVGALDVLHFDDVELALLVAPHSSSVAGTRPASP